MQFRNATFNAVGTVDCEIEHPVYGWIPFTASPDDVEPLGRDVFAAAQADAAPYIAPVIDPAAILADWRENAAIPRAEFCVNANTLKLLADADAEKAAAGAWPDAFEPIIATWPLADRIRARAKWADNPLIYRSDPLLALLAGATGLSAEQIDVLCGWTG